jgi:hypothetical protein
MKGVTFMNVGLISLYIIAILILTYIVVPYFFSFSSINLSTAFKNSFKAPLQKQGTRSVLFFFQISLLIMTVIAVVSYLYLHGL